MITKTTITRSKPSPTHDTHIYDIQGGALNDPEAVILMVVHSSKEHGYLAQQPVVRQRVLALSTDDPNTQRNT